MTDRAKFEQMLEYLINEDQEKAKEIFHTIVVEKSREIYENLLAEDFDDIEEAKDEDDEEVDESTGDEDDEEMEENFAFDEAGDDMEMSMDDEDDDSMDATDDFMGDIEAGDDMDGEGDVEDRVQDLEDALEDLKAEFEKLMSDDDMGDDMGGDDMGGDDMDMGMDDEEDSKMEDDMFMREYVEKVPAGHGAEKKGAGEKADNTKSIVAGKNNMGGTTANITKGGVEPESASTKGGLLNPSTKENNAGNVNTPGSKSATKWNNTKGHGAEKKGAGEVGGTNTKSIIGRR